MPGITENSLAISINLTSYEIDTNNFINMFVNLNRYANTPNFNLLNLNPYE